jgi:hypothetical protein
MNTNKIMYWLVLGIFAVGLHSEYRNGKFPAIHRLADHAESSLCQLVARAEQTVTLARVLSDRQHSGAGDLMPAAREQEMAQAELLRDQAREHAQLLREQAHAQAEMIRAQVEVQRSQIDQLRWRTQSRIKFANATNRRVILVCPKTGARISVDAEPPDVEVGDNF